MCCEFLMVETPSPSKQSFKTYQQDRQLYYSFFLVGGGGDPPFKTFQQYIKRLYYLVPSKQKKCLGSTRGTAMQEM